MISLSPTRIDPNIISSDLFGGNILATRDKVGESGTFDDVANDLGVDTIRYPGGSLTEQSFDLTDPDKGTSFNGGYFLKYTDFMTYAEAENKSVTIVIPTKDYLTEAIDKNGERFANIDEATVRQFVKDTLDGKYGSPQIKAFEIGNEYWGSGEMSSVEYGRVSSEMAVIIRDEIDSHPHYDSSFFNIDIVVQMGNNYGEGRLSDFYSGSTSDVLNQLSQDYDYTFGSEFLTKKGAIDWTKIANQLILNEFNEEERDAIDGVVAHVYSKGTDFSRTFDLAAVESTWHKQIEGLDTYVTEWNLSSKSGKLDKDQDYGLKQAHELLEIMEEFVAYDVDLAHVWPLQQNTKTDLSGDEGQTDLTVAGTMFKMMSENMQGKNILDLSPSEHTEFQNDELEVHSFYDETELLFYIYSRSETPIEEVVDLSSIIKSYESVEIEVLGVKEGQIPTTPNAKPEVRQETGDIIQDNQISVNLNPYEVMQIKLVNPEYTTFMDSIPRIDEDGSEHEYVESEEDQPNDALDSLDLVLSSLAISLFIGLLMLV